MAEQKFDVFLCHNSEDKPAVIEVAERLRRQGLKPWLDVWELQPGVIWQYALEQQIESIGAVAVFVGQQGLGPWQSEEIYAFLQEFISHRCPVIPVMLPEIRTQPRLPVFLKNRHWVDFRLQEPDPFSQLIWGITGERPDNSAGTAKRVSLKGIKRPPPTKNPVLDARYADLERYLKNGQWEKADNETYRLMIREVGKEEGKYLGGGNLKTISCKSLNTIDGLWVRHSAGRFGFSVQKRIYLDSCGGFLSDNISLNNQIDHLQKFIKMNGWDDGLKYDIASPIGHLPGVRQFGHPWQMRSCGGVVYCLFVRLQACDL